MAKFITVADVSTLPPGGKLCLDAQNVPLVLFNADGQVTAMLNVCPHAGLPLGQGEFHGNSITCPFHGYTYHCGTGHNVDFDGDVPATMLPVRCENGKIEVDIEPLLKK
jgi:nitrite reductase/ring-hydroxylating ferredoxin subunit